MPTQSSTSVVTSRRYNRTRTTIPGSDTGDQLANTDRVTITRSKTGVSCPNWRKRIKSGVSATTGFSGVEEDYAPGHGHAELQAMNDTTKSVSTWTLSGGWPRIGTIPNPTGIAVATAQSRAKIDFLNQARSALVSFDTGVFFGEIREALELVRSPAKIFHEGLFNYLHSLPKRVRNSTAREKSRKLSEAWLEYKFGWKQLYNDTLDGAKALSKATMQPRFYKIEGKGHDEDSVIQDGIDYSLSFLLVDSTLRIKRTADVLIRGIVDGRVPFSSFGSHAGQQFGLFPENFLPTVWNLIPWSFVVDYFTGIGNLISARSVCVRQIGWASNTAKQKVEAVTELNCYDSLPNGWTRLYLSSAFSPAKRTRKNIVRVVQPDWDVGLDDLVGSLTLPHGLQWLNLAALRGASSEVSRRISRL